MSRTSYDDTDLSGHEMEDLSEVTQRIVHRGPLQRHRLPTIRVVAGRDLLRHVVLNAGEEILIGRDETCELRLTDPTVSKRHARVVADASNAITVFDLGSTNGTAVNSRAVTRTLLRPGDMLEVGGVSIRLDLLSLDELGHLARVVERLEAANRDPLTGLLSRAFIEDELPVLMEQWDRNGLPASCAFVDLDNFKSVNDTYGHHIGDEVLQAVGRLVLVSVRDADPAVKYGGEEIVLFLPGSEEEAAAQVSERVRRNILQHDWNRTSAGLNVTASFGVAERHEGESIRDWIRRADEALYKAKRSGRNRVVRSSSLS